MERIEGRIGPDTRFDLVVTGPLTAEAMRRLTAAVELFSSAVTDKPAELAGGER